MLVAGSGYGYEELPALKGRHPGLEALDLIFNTAGSRSRGAAARLAGAAPHLDATLVENAEVRDWVRESAPFHPPRFTTVESGVDLQRATGRAKPICASASARGRR